MAGWLLDGGNGVSTHSRPKAAGKKTETARIFDRSFNTQPPEGGWITPSITPVTVGVSTHSRPKAAGILV